MISNLKPSTQQFLNDLGHIEDNLQRAQRQISTGLRVSRVSDAPDQISNLLTARAGLSTAQQIQANLSRYKTEVDAGEQALQTAVQLFDHVQTLGAQGNTDTATNAARAALAQELGSILEEMGGLAGTAVEGRYIFSGDSDQTAPYTVDLTQSNPVSAYQGAAVTRVAQHPNGTTFTIAETAQTIFDSTDPATNVFGAIAALRTALLSNGNAAIQTAVGGLSKVSEYLNNQLAFYGTTQNKISEAANYGKALETQLQTQISSIQDADMTEAITELTQAQTQQQAALESRAQMPRTTLFDYLG